MIERVDLVENTNEGGGQSSSNPDKILPVNTDVFFINRLTRFARIASEADASQIPQWRRLARAATLSAYRDCASIGLERQAREILSRTIGNGSRSA